MSPINFFTFLFQKASSTLKVFPFQDFYAIKTSSYYVGTEEQFEPILFSELNLAILVVGNLIVDLAENYF